MANYFDTVIENVKEINGGRDDEVIAALRAKRDELGDDVTEEEAKEAIHECLLGQLSEIISHYENEPVELSEKDKECKAKACAVVKEFFDDEDWHYGVNEVREDLTVYDLSFGIKGVNLRMRVYVEADPNVCRIEAILPVSAESTYEYPLCAALMKENYQKRFGSFKYDEDDGEITYEYSFLVQNGIVKDDLETYFHAVVGSAVSCYEDIRKYSLGRFKSSEIKDIFKKVNDLVSDISQ